ncbi:MAG: hypothetical protein IT186_05320 [Acidobacteria bacterium]|nr:hypothetical protein [Acidobacteriota bacterium]MCG3194759.1 hypothetical protein [Thermoanaerobaculia bacterium]
MKKQPMDDESYALAEKRLLQAASAGPLTPSPFFVKRVVAASRSVRPASPLGFLAWRLVPGVAALTVALCGWGAYETRRLERATENVLSSLAGRESSPSDAVLAAAFLGGSTPSAQQEGGVR